MNIDDPTPTISTSQGRRSAKASSMLKIDWPQPLSIKTALELGITGTEGAIPVLATWAEVDRHCLRGPGLGPRG